MLCDDTSPTWGYTLSTTEVHTVPIIHGRHPLRVYTVYYVGPYSPHHTWQHLLGVIHCLQLRSIQSPPYMAGTHLEYTLYTMGPYSPHHTWQHILGVIHCLQLRSIHGRHLLKDIYCILYGSIQSPPYMAATHLEYILYTM